MRILITGGSGMLGKAIVNTLKKSPGDHVVYSPSHSELDLLNQKTTCNYLGENQIDSIIHCAALVGGIQANIANPFEYLNTNIRLDANLMSAALAEKVSNFLYIASSCMYPANTSQPMKENQLLTGEFEKTNEGYALAKIVGTKTVQAVGVNLNWRTLVLSNLYGPGDKYEIANSHLVAAIIRKVIEAKATNSKYIKMWGTGNVRREFTFVNDVAEYISTIIFRLDKTPQIMNLGSGVDYSVQEYYDLVCEAVHYKGEVISDPSQPEGMLTKLMDSSIANENGWRPSTNIKEGIKLAINDFMLILEGKK
jgi:nucleoside-diphosphate-sugar epimerase